jgi:dihydroorotate dehydrogenase
MGLSFKNPIGLAAGFDKNGIYIQEMAALGFGFVEIGTVTPMPQPGNAKPRLFRLPADNALINRMGFNNDGVDVVAYRLKHLKNKNIIIGGNIGKNKVTTNEEAVNDYEICFKILFDVVDYFVVNVSSPNTPGLRELQEREPLLHILNRLQELNFLKEKPKPILLKIAPDLSLEHVDDIISIVKETKITGVIAVNTTIERNNLTTPQQEVKRCGAGGLSGKPLFNKSLALIKHISEKSQKQFVIIGVGGISTGEDVKKMLDAGANLVQLYTGLIYEGPGIVKNINTYLSSTK